MTKAIILEWKVKEGDWVEEHQEVMEIETEKVKSDLEAMASGFVYIVVASGNEVSVGEVVGLRPSDIRWEAGELHLTHTKGGRHRVVPLSEETLGYLRLWTEKRPAGGTKRFFTTLRGTPVSPRYVQAMVAREAESAGIERRVHPHMLRHTYATELLDERYNIREVQELLGHANLSTTQIYTHVNLGELKEKMKQRGQTADEADEAQRVLKALLALPKEQREALAEALST